MIRHYIEKIKQSSLFTDSVWSLFGSAIGRGLSLIAGIVIARFLGKDLYGEYGIIKTTLIYIEIFSTFGLGYTATKYIAYYRKHKLSDVYSVCKLTLRTTLATSGIMAVMVLLFAKPIAVLIDAPHLYNILRISAIGIVFNAINVAQIGILSGFGKFKVIAKNTTFSGIIIFLLTIPLTYCWGIDGAVISLVLTFFIQCIFNNISVNSILSKYEKNHIKSGLCREMLTFSLPIALQESLYSIVNWVISFMLIKLCGYGELGLYSAASQWAAIISFIPGILRNVTLSHLSSNIDNKLTHDRTINAMLLFSAVSTSIMFIGVVVCINRVCSFYGDSFNGLREVLITQSFCAIITSISNVYIQEFISRGNNWEVFILRLIRDTLSIFMAYFLFVVYTKTSGALILSASVLIMNVLYLMTLRLMYGQYLKKTIINEN